MAQDYERRTLTLGSPEILVCRRVIEGMRLVPAVSRIGDRLRDREVAGADLHLERLLERLHLARLEIHADHSTRLGGAACVESGETIADADIADFRVGGLDGREL